MSIRILYLLRHAEAKPAEDDEADFERDLTVMGRAQCGRLHDRLGDIQFDQVLCSPVRRTMETLRLSLKVKPSVTIRDNEFYGMAAEQWLNRIRTTTGNVSSQLIVAHNPGLHDLAVTLASKGRPFPRRMPPGTLVKFTLNGDWTGIRAGKCTLEDCFNP